MNSGDDILFQAKTPLRGWPDCETVKTLSMNPTGGWIGWSVEDRNDQGRVIGSNEVEFDMSVGGPLNIFIERDPHDREDGRYLEIDIPNEHVFAIHEWLTRRLYGAD